MSLHRIERSFLFFYHCRTIDTALVRSMALKMSKQNHSHLIILFSNHHYLYSLVHISSIKSGTEVVEDLSLRRIKRRFLFCYHRRDIDRALVRYITLNMSLKNHSHFIISFSKLHHLYYFVHISSIKAGTEVVEDLSFRRIERRFRFFYHWRAIDTALVR